MIKTIRCYFCLRKHHLIWNGFTSFGSSFILLVVIYFEFTYSSTEIHLNLHNLLEFTTEIYTKFTSFCSFYTETGKFLCILLLNVIYKYEHKYLDINKNNINDIVTLKLKT